MYRPPNTGLNADRQLISYLTSASEKYANLVVMGDFNHPSIDWTFPRMMDSTTAAADFNNMLIQSNLTQHVKEPTRYRTNQLPSLLDLVLSNTDDLITECQVLPPIGNSDHVCLISTIQISSYPQSQNATKKISKIDHNRLRSLLDVETWQSSPGNPQEKWTCFEHTLNQHIATSTHTFSVIQNQRKPYITADVIRSAKFKRTLWRRYKLSNSEADFKEYRDLPIIYLSKSNSKNISMKVP